MKKTVAVMSMTATLALTTPALGGTDSSADLVSRYKQTGNSIVDMVNSKNVSASEVEQKVLDLTKDSVELANRYKALYPEGTALLDTVINQVAQVQDGQVEAIGPMAELTFGDIESQWHDLGHFEAKDLGVDLSDEDNEHFTDPIHVMVHPIMVLRAARDFEASQSDDDLNLMKGEMEEGMEQAEIIEGLLE